MKKERFNPHSLVVSLVALLALLGFILLVFYINKNSFSFQQNFFLLFFSALTIILLLLRKFSFTIFFLLSTFTLLITWRLCALAHLILINYIYFAAMLLKFCLYINFAYQNIIQIRKTKPNREPAYIWQLLFIRLAIGFDLVPHFTEKLFAGSVIRAEDVHAFAQLGVPHSLTMVIISGCIELAGAFSISCGFLTRLGAICFFIYLMIATFLGHHFMNGFIWAIPGGGWEFPVLWGVIILSFAVFGAGDFSLDYIFKNNYNVPNWIKHLMGGRFA